MKTKNTHSYVDTKLRGYSDNRLQPIYLLCTSLFFLAWPVVGPVAAFLLISIPAFFVAYKIAQRQMQNPVASYNYSMGIQMLYHRLAIRDIIREHPPIMVEEIRAEVRGKQPEPAHFAPKFRTAILAR